MLTSDWMGFYRATVASWRTLIVGMVFGWAGLSTFSQTGPLRWHWSNPTPHGNTLGAVVYHKGLMVEVCELGRIYSSLDLDHWQSQPSPTSNALRAATYLGDRLVIVGEKGTVLYGDSVADLRLVNLATSDWLEGVAASSTTLVAVGDNGAIYSSSDGQVWNRGNGVSKWLRAVSYANNSFVAVGEGGFIARSADGVAWSSENSGTVQDLNTVQWINGRWIAAGEGGTLLAKDPIFGWRSESSPATNSIYTIAGNSASMLVAGAGLLQKKENGFWIDAIGGGGANTVPDWTYTTALWDGAEFFVGGRSGLVVEAFKTNSTSATLFVESSPSPRYWLWDILRSADFYVSVGNAGTIMTSENGAKWNVESVPDAKQNSYLLGIGGSPNLLVAVGNAGTILTSPNVTTNVVRTNADGTVTNVAASLFGIQWNVASAATTKDLQGVTWRDGIFVVCGGGGVILTSTDGKAWTQRNSPVSSYLSSSASFSGGFVITGDAGIILTSSDGVNWVVRASGTKKWIYKVRNLNGQLFAVGDGGTILGSKDGAAWTAQSTGTTAFLNDIATTDGISYAVGTDGVVLTSAGRNLWVATVSITRKSLYGLAVNGGGQMIAVGMEGAILRSQVGPFTNPIQFVDFGVAAGEALFLIAGEPDQVFDLETTTELNSWNPAAPEPIEISDPDGIIVYARPGVEGGAQFFRARNEP
jgi:hypothetical protein